MDFTLTREQVALKKLMRQFFEATVGPYTEQIDAESAVPQEILDAFKEMHLFGMACPKQYGGAGGTTFDYMLVQEELGKVWAGGTLMLGTHTITTTALQLFGTNAQKEKYLPKLASGEAIGSFAFTEASTGTDYRALTTRAVLDNGKYVINGTKRFITNPNFAGFIILFARTGDGVTAFIVDKESEGYSVSQPWHKMGCRGPGLHDVYFKNVVVDPEDILGKENDGFTVLKKSIAQGGKLGVISMLLGIGGAALDEAVQYAKEREVRGKPIANMQHIQGLIAVSAAKLEACRLIAYRAASYTDQGIGDLPFEAAQVKLFVSENIREIVHNCLQVHGAYGYIEDFKIERLYRDARLGEVIEGTTEVQKTIVGGGILRK